MTILPVTAAALVAAGVAPDAAAKEAARRIGNAPLDQHIAAQTLAAQRAEPKSAGARVLTFEMPAPPNRANARGHWRAIHREKEAFWAALDAIKKAGGFSPPPIDPWPCARYNAHWFLGAENDEDNLVARIKWVLDWLCTSGFVRGDQRKRLRMNDLPTLTVTRKIPPTLVLNLHFVKEPTR